MKTLLVLIIVLVATAIWLVVLLRIGRGYRDKRQRKAIFIMLVLGCLSILPGWLAYGASIFGLFVSASRYLWYNFLVVGLTEESVKFMLFVVAALIMKSIRDPYHGMAQGAAVGVGFAAVEDVIYGLDFGVATAFHRAYSLGFHALSGALWGFAFATAICAASIRRRKWIPVFASVVGAAFLHGLFNAGWGYLLSGYDAARVLPFVVQLIALCLTILGFLYLLRRSPYHRYAFSDAEEAIQRISDGQRMDPEAKELIRRLAVYQMAAGKYEESLGTWYEYVEAKWSDPIVEAHIAVSIIGASESIDGRNRLTRAIESLGEHKRNRLERHFLKISNDETMARYIRQAFHRPEETIDKWMANRRRLGMHESEDSV